MLIPLAHGESESSAAALAHLNVVARYRIDLAKDTAMASGTTKEKQSIIRNQIKQLSSIVEQGELRVLEERIEGNLAGVLVSRIIDYDPGQVQVLAIAMLKRDDRWLPAPMRASFENTGISYLPGIAQDARDLESWMLSERTRQLTRLRQDVQAELLADIRKAGSLDELRQLSKEDLVEGFIEACRARDLPAALVYLGGLEEPLPEDWDETLRFVSSCMGESADTNQAWQRITNHSGARAIIETDTFGDGAFVSVGEFSPLENSPVNIATKVFHFPLDKVSGDHWRLRLPSWLLEGKLPGKADPTDQELIEKFPAKLLARQQPLSFSSPDDLMESFQTAFSGPRFEALLPYISLPESGEAQAVLEKAAKLWRFYRGRDSQAPLLLEVRKQDDQACALVSLFDARNPQISKGLIKPIFLQEKDGNWSIPSEEPETSNEARETLREWADEASKLDEDEWMRRMNLTAILGGIPADSAPSEEDALAAAQAWLDAIRSRNPRHILKSVATFDDVRGLQKLFRTIGHELQAAHETEILKIHRHGRWAAVSTQAISDQRDEEPYYMLYPIVTTPSGARVFAESVLFHADTRSREFLNSSVWSRLGDRLPDAAVAELREIQNTHNKLAEKQ
ncbi:hypothetical protein [Haloferula sp.]|uniref:hypothetical protein n=1 Tax=Haloferula sp. TaxID=2497595 RepID=UPI003C74A641